jgi:hypothetical protein
MRATLNLLFFILFTTAFAQKVTVKITQYNSDGKITNETVKVTERPLNAADLSFFKKQFGIPKEVPDKLSDGAHKNKMIVNWHNEKQEKNLNSNWNYTYTYDSLSRVIAYTYSGCLTCTPTAYKYLVNYNKSGQVETLRNTINGNELYRVYYNDKGSIIQIDLFTNDKLVYSLLTDL